MNLTVTGKQQSPFVVYKITTKLEGRRDHVYIGFTSDYKKRIKSHMTDRRRIVCEALIQGVSTIEIVSDHNSKNEARDAERWLINDTSFYYTINLLNSHHVLQR